MLMEFLDRFDMTDPEELAWLSQFQQHLETNGRNFARRLEQEIFDAALKRDRCPECFQQLILKNTTAIYTDRDTTYRVPTIEAQCTSCGWKG